MTSFNLGTPKVTFLDDTPAKWKVFNVIYVAGSPKLWAAIEPTISPGCTRLYSNLDLISPISQSKAGAVNLSFYIIFLVQRAYLKYIFINLVEFSFASEKS